MSEFFQPVSMAEQQAMSFFNTQPTQVKGQWNDATLYHKQELYRKAMSVFKFDLPKEWALNWFRFWLFQWGSIALIYTYRYGWICQPYSVVYLNYQYQPDTILVTNSYLKQEIYGKIGINAQIIRLFDDFYGLEPIVCRYAEMLADAEKAVQINLMNANVAYFFEAESKKKAMEIKEAYSKASKGEPLVIVNNQVLKGNKLQPLLAGVKSNFIATDLMEVRRAIMNAFLTEIGIRNVSVQKKERLTAGENNENNDETRSIAEIMLENMKIGFTEFEKISGIHCGVEFRYDYVAPEPTPRTATPTEGRGATA